MGEKLLALPADRLLKKFGAGNHKPGSGSAAALQGMLSAQLIRTVINLTIDLKRPPHYSESVPRLEEMDSEIESRIYPALARLFQEDSLQFDKVIKLRQARDDENTVKRKRVLRAQALKELRPATEIPIEIAKLCVELADFAGFVFDNGFKSARGDSGVALNSAIAAVSGCIAIVDLNLLSFGSNKWTDNIRLEADLLRNRYEDLSSKIIERLQGLREEADEHKSYSVEVNELLSGEWTESKLSDPDIERMARQLQNLLWKYRGKIWKNDIPENPIDVLNVEIACKLLGYRFDRSTRLGQYEDQGGLFEVAGLIDNQQNTVAISEQFSPEMQNFTAAHELGHALLHQQSALHRDRALDGSAPPGSRSLHEIQADKLASYFLMPSKQIKKIFQTLFLTEKFEINEDTAFALNAGRAEVLRARCRDLRGLARTLASAKFFNGREFNSLSEQFRVSVEAMAIRLEELKLLEF